MHYNKNIYALPLLAGSLVLGGCLFGNVKKEGRTVDGGPGWNYPIDEDAVDSVRRILSLRKVYLDEDLPQVSSGTVSGIDLEENKRNRLERLLAIDANRDKRITKQEAFEYEEANLKDVQDAILKEDKANPKTLLQHFRGK